MKNRPKQLTSALIVTGLLCLAAMTSAANELHVEAPVIDVEPLSDPPREVEHCPRQAPAGATLVETLSWDLGLQCRTERVQSATVTGYRVFYRWDDRVYSRVMRTAPGPTVPLKVRLD